MLFIGLGACPQLACARQLRSETRPLPAPLLPVEVAWEVSLPSLPSAAGALDEARAYFLLETGRLVALNRETGATEWTFELESAHPPVVEGGVLYVTGGSQLHAVSAATGTRLWNVSLDASMRAPLVIRSGTLIALVEPGVVRAFRTKDGQEVWSRMLGSTSDRAAMTADAASVYVSFGSRLIRLALTDGSLRWERLLPGALTPPTLAGDRVFVGSMDTFYAFHPEKGRLEWRWRWGGEVVGAVADNRFVYVAAHDNLLRALHRGSGNQVWKRELSTRTAAPPLTFGGIVVVLGRNPRLSTFDALTGTPIATLSAPADLRGGLLIDHELRPFRVAMVGVTADGKAVGLRPSAMMFREAPLVPLPALPGRMLTRERLSTPNSTPDSRPATTNR